MGTEQIYLVINFKQACQVWDSPSVNVIIRIYLQKGIQWVLRFGEGDHLNNSCGGEGKHVKFDSFQAGRHQEEICSGFSNSDK